MLLTTLAISILFCVVLNKNVQEGLLPFYKTLYYLLFYQSIFIHY